MMIEKWDRRFMDMAKLVGSWSKDPSTKVGAVVVDSDNRVISVGYNGFAKGVDDSNERYEMREFKYAAVIHAEENAILFANQNLDGCTIYVLFPPCSNCAAKIAQCGIKRVVTLQPTEEQLKRWGDSFNIATIILKETNVELCFLNY